MKRKGLWISLFTLIIIVAIGLGVCTILKVFNSINADTNFNVEALRWTIIGAIGSWMGSIFSAIALVISLLALWLPQRVKIKATISTGFMLSQMPGVDKIDAYIITVKNMGSKPVTISNVYLHFGNKKRGDIFVGTLNQNSILEVYTPKFPKRLEQGESFDYYLLRDRLNAALVHYEKKTPMDIPFSIRVDEVTKGSKYYKTKWTLGTFVKHETKNEN